MMIFYLTSCEYNRIVKPEADFRLDKQSYSHKEHNAKYSYNIYHLHQIVNSIKPVEKALLDSFETFEITDVVKTDNVIQDRTCIFVYIFEPISDSRSGIVDEWWFLISLGTLFTVPYYSIGSSPVEIHLINQQKGNDNKIRIIKTEFTTELIMWSPFVFKSEEEAVRNKHTLYEKYRAKNEYEYLDYIGFRRIFDRIIAESLKN